MGEERARRWKLVGDANRPPGMYVAQGPELRHTEVVKVIEVGYANRDEARADQALAGGRRMTSIRYVLRQKAFTGGWLARVRALWWIVVCRHETEICMECGRPVGLVWWCHDDALWDAVTGYERGLERETATGLLCIPCFDRMARPHCSWIEWAPRNLRHLSDPVSQTKKGEGDD